MVSDEQACWDALIPLAANYGLTVHRVGTTWVELRKGDKIVSSGNYCGDALAWLREGHYLPPEESQGG